METREKIIQSYIDAYNRFDVHAMVKNFDPSIEFENITNGSTNLKLSGIEAFVEQAERAKNYFSERAQMIKAIRHRDAETEVDIDYRAILAINIPNGLKTGEELKLQGKSVFRFSGDKIICLTDIS